MTTPFSLDPTLPWLFSDPTMQEPAAFRGLQTLTLNAQTWEPMGRYFPGGTQVAMRRVTHLDQLVEGAAYWHEMTYFEGQQRKTRYHFGRYAGPDPTTNEKRRAQRWKRGEAHVVLEADVLDCPLRSYLLRDDGTQTVFVDVKDGYYTLHELTHYVSLPAPWMAELGPEAVKQTGLTLKQATWLRQEQELLQDGVELTAQVSGNLFGADCRVLLHRDKVKDFLWLQESVPQLTPGQATRCKSGTVAITYRSRKASGLDYHHTEYYKLAAAAALLDWLRPHSEVQKWQLQAAISQQQVGYAAAAYRARLREQVTQAEAAALAGADTPTLPLPTRPDYAGVEELALAA